MVAHYLMIMGTPRYLSQVLKEPAREQPSGRGYGQKGSDPLRRISLYPGSTLGESSLPSTTYRQMILSAALEGGSCGGEKRRLLACVRSSSLPLGGLVFVIILDVLEDLVREVQLPVHVAGILIIGVRADWELLLVLP